MGRIVVGSDNHLQGDMLNFLHDGALGSHSGMASILYKIRQIYYHNPQLAGQMRMSQG